MQTFQELIASRREWIDTVLKPWCQHAKRINLVLAEQEWVNLAGQPAPEMTLWMWAWGRFPVLCEEGLPTINETRQVIVETKDGTTITGYPDARETQQGELVLAQDNGKLSEPISIDDIVSVRNAEMG